MLTDERVKTLELFIGAGNYYNVSCKAAGIAESTFYGWMDRGEKEAEDFEQAMVDYEGKCEILQREGKPTDKLKVPEKTVYTEFMENIKIAQAKREAKWVQDINNDDAWQSKAWLLERSKPERWGRKDNMDLNVAGNVTLVAGNQFRPNIDQDKQLTDEREESD